MRKYKNPLKTLTRPQAILWICSLTIISLSFILCPQRDILTLFACLVGVSALTFISKGDPLGQILTVVFAIMYSVISIKFRYYGEMITYMGMTTPTAIAAAISWFKNPHSEEDNQVRVARVSVFKLIALAFASVAVSVGFYFILRYFNTTNLILSTVSIFTSFFASMLTFLRSPLYGLAYAANDVVLIILWVLATIETPSYLPMIFCFAVFLINDCYGFYNWQRMKKIQASQLTPAQDKNAAQKQE